MKLDYRRDIDGLRGIAVMAVVLYHFFPSFLQGGYLGVDVFFVISGYLITSILSFEIQDSNFQIFNFYSRRIKRLSPALILVLAASSIAGWFILSPLLLNKLGTHILGAMTFSSNFVFWSESHYFDSSSIIKPLWHLWSLGVEEQFYIVWPMILWGVWRTKLKNNHVIIFLLITSIMFCFSLQVSDQDQVFFSPLTRAAEILVGAGLSGVQFKMNKLQSNIYSLFGFFILGSAFLLTNEKVPYPMAFVMPVLGAAIIICSGEKSYLNSTLLSSKILVWFGLISYPLYLWHWPILSFSKLLNVSRLDFYINILLILISIVLAWFTFYFIESPVRKNKFSKSLIVLVMLMVLIVFLGLFFKNYKNSDLRMPSMLKDLMARNDLKALHTKGWRENACYLNKEQDYAAFQNCPDIGNLNSGKSIVVWGDSHAAQLLPGVLKKYQQDFKIIQRTASACPPLLKAGKENLKYCKKINDSVFDSIKTIKPEKVILAGRWHIQPWFFLEETITNLKKVGVKDIVVIGPFPYWHLGLPNQLFWEYQNGPTRLIPKRTKDGLDQEIFILDEQIKKFVESFNVKYVSAIKILCNVEGCLTRTGNAWEDVISFDQSHLTTSASEFFVSKIDDAGNSGNDK